jgi:hypothetical protein
MSLPNCCEATPRTIPPTDRAPEAQILPQTRRDRTNYRRSKAPDVRESSRAIYRIARSAEFLTSLYSSLHRDIMIGHVEIAEPEKAMVRKRHFAKFAGSARGGPAGRLRLESAARHLLAYA